MKGYRAFLCLLRGIEINRRLSNVLFSRYFRVAGCINTRNSFYTSAWLRDKTKDSDLGTHSGSSDSGSDESSDGSESDSDIEIQTGSQEERVGQDLMSLLAKMKASEEKWGTQAKAESKLKEIEHSVDSKLVTEAVKLCKELPGDPERSESALIGQLLSQFETTAQQRRGAAPRTEGSKKKELSAIMEGISIEKEYKKHRKGRADSKQFDEDDDIQEGDKRLFTYRTGGSGLLSGTPLGIFTEDNIKSTQTERQDLFEIVKEEEDRQLELYPPQNALEEQIQLTKEGKLWTFPIDNEAGWEEEKKVDFMEHVFLEHKLKCFPQEGPVRHFMELVTLALGKNPYLTIEQKHETIEWYRNYFKEREEVLEATLGEEGLIDASN